MPKLLCRYPSTGDGGIWRTLSRCAATPKWRQEFSVEPFVIIAKHEFTDWWRVVGRQLLSESSGCERETDIAG